MALVARLLGGCSFVLDGHALGSWPTRKADGLLAYLCVTPREHPRTTLATLLWGDSTEAQANANLRVVLSALRRDLGPAFTATRAGVRLDVTALDCDRVSIDGLLHDGLSGPPNAARVASLTQACGLYTGDFLDGLLLRGAPGFEEWQLQEREHLRSRMVRAREVLLRWHAERDEIAVAIEQAERILALDPLNEAADLEILRLHGRRGDRAAVHAHFDAAVTRWQRLTGRPPRPQLGDLATRLAAPPPSVLGALPGSHGPLVGREKELAALVEMLSDPYGRLVTVLGPGGIGKTRLAEAAAVALAPRFPHGAWWIPLAAVTDLPGLLSAVTSALGLAPEAADPATTVTRWLRERKVLLVLDTAEDVLEPLAAVLPGWLREAPGVRVLCTSRQPLELVAEARLPLAGLPVGEGASDAVRLLAHTIRRLAPLSPLVRDPGLVDVCRALDGHPLALELSASALLHTTPAELVRRLDTDLRALQGRERDRPRRHGSLHAAFDFGFGLLPAPARRVLLWLSCFRGAFDVAAVTALGGSAEALDALARRSLVSPTGSERWRLLRPVRTLAGAELAADPAERLAAERAHRRYVAAEADRVEGSLWRADHVAALDTWRRLADDAEAAWAVDDPDTFPIIGRAMRSALDALTWWREGHRRFSGVVTSEPVGEGVRRVGEAWFSLRFGDAPAALRVLDGLPPDAAAEDRRKGRAMRATALQAVGRREEASALASDVLAEAESVGDLRNAVAMLATLAGLARGRGDSAEAERLLLRSVAYLEADRKEGFAGGAWHNLGALARERGDLRAARTHLLRALDLRRRYFDRRGTALTLATLGGVEMEDGDASCVPRFEEAQRIAEDLEDDVTRAHALHHLGQWALLQGRAAEADRHAAAALTLQRGLSDRRWEVTSRVDWARIHLRRGARPLAAAQLLAALDRLGDDGDARVLALAGELGAPDGDVRGFLAGIAGRG